MYNYFVEELLRNGIREDTLLYALSIPIIIVILNISRYLIGVKSFKTYTTIALVFLIFETGKTFALENGNDKIRGILFGGIVIGIVFGATILSYNLIHRLKLHYLPKITTAIIGSSIGILLTLFIAERLNIQEFLRINSLVIVLLVIVTDEILEIYLKKNVTTTFFTLIETFVIATVSYFIIVADTTKEIIFKYPYVISIFVGINILLGKYTGLRLSEYTRFYDLLVDKIENKDEDISDTEE